MPNYLEMSQKLFSSGKIEYLECFLQLSAQLHELFALGEAFIFQYSQSLLFLLQLNSQDIAGVLARCLTVEFVRTITAI
jgi:hypothetical protein